MKSNPNYQLYCQLFNELKKYRNVRISRDLQKSLIKDLGNDFCKSEFIFSSGITGTHIYLNKVDSLQKFKDLLR